MWIALDVIVAAILILSLISGYKKGFIKTAFSLGILIASIIISSSFSPVLSTYVRTTSQYISFTQSIKNNVVSNFTQSQDALEKEEFTNTDVDDTQKTQNEVDQISKFYEKMSDLGIDLDFEDLEKTYRESIDSGVLSAAEALDEVVIQPISKMLCDALCFVVVFLLSVLTLNLLKLVLELVFKLPLLKGMNKTSGAVVGVLFGVLKVFAFCTIFQVLLPYIKNADLGITLDIAEKTYLYSFFLEMNPLKFLY